jgi:hypothetical protein
VEVEITSSYRVTPQTQMVASPDRLVIDFPQALPGGNLHSLTVNRGEVTRIRVGLFAAHPPVTRVVLDLKGPREYTLVPSGNSVIVRVGVRGTSPAMMSPAPAIAPAPPPKPAPKVEVRYQDGLLSIWADKATLAEVLSEIQRCTGADIPIPAGAEHELVVARMAPANAEEALASLLNGSRFNFILVGSATDPAALRSVILTPRSGIPAGQVISSVTPVTAAASLPEPPVAGAPLPPDQEAPEEDTPVEPPPVEPPQQ